MMINLLLAVVSVKGPNFIAGLGTVLIFIGIFSFKAAFLKRKLKEGDEVPVKNRSRIMLLSAGVICFALGILLIFKSLKII